MMKYACALFRIQGGYIILIALYNVFLNGTSYVATCSYKQEKVVKINYRFSPLFFYLFFMSLKKSINSPKIIKDSTLVTP